MTNFTIDLKTKVYFGEGVAGDALIKEKNLLIPPVMIVTTGRSLYKHGYISELESMINSLCDTTLGENVIIYDSISNNPDISEVADAVLIARESGVRTVVGFGGGSSLDAAKAIAAGIPGTETMQDMLIKGLEPPADTLPIIAIPTTAGTGSELSKAAIISDRSRGTKGGIRGENLIPRLAIVDPKYTWSVPASVTSETGFDVLAHAVESYISVKATMHSRMLSEYTIRTVSDALVRLKNNPEDHDARAEMSYCSMLMGMNLKDVGTALPHRMQYPVGAHTDTGHGIGLTALYPSWIAHEYEFNRAKTEDIYHLMGLDHPTDPGSAGTIMRDYLSKIGIETSLKDLGITDISPATLASEVTGNIANDPISVHEGMIETIYRESM